VGKLSSYTAETVLVDGDYVMVIDVSDTSQSPTGSLNKMLASSVATSAPFTSRFAPETTAVAALTPTTGTVDLDLATVNGKYLTHSLSGNPTYTSSNRAAGKTVTIKVIAGGGTRTLSFPSWVFVGTEPTDIASGKTGILTVTWFDTTDAGAVAAWAVEA
jgi:hypothetical protein